MPCLCLFLYLNYLTTQWRQSSVRQWLILPLSLPRLLARSNPKYDLKPYMASSGLCDSIRKPSRTTNDNIVYTRMLFYDQEPSTPSLLNLTSVMRIHREHWHTSAASCFTDSPPFQPNVVLFTLLVSNRSRHFAIAFLLHLQEAISICYWLPGCLKHSSVWIQTEC